MRSNVLKFARQGLWPALSGGWYYDPNHSSFTNVFHMYTWILLLCLPFALYQTTVITWQVTLIYSVVLAVLICLIKFASSHLHKTFDIGEQMQRKTVPLEADKEQISENLSSGETRVRFQGAGDQADENFNQASFGDNNANEGAGHMHLWDEISKNPEFTDGDLFMKLQDDSNKTSKTQVDVHHDDNFPVVMMPGTSADSTSGKRRRTRKKKARTPLDKCNSLPSVSSSDSEVSKTYNTQLSTPVASGDEKEENSPKSTNADGSPKQFRIQRKAGFRNRPRPKRPSAKDPSVDDFYSFASGDGIGPRKDSRKRNAPQDGTQGPQHKRSYSSADVESQRRHKEINKMSSVEQTKLELKKLKSQSLPSSSPSGTVVDDVRLLLKSDEDTGENDDKSAKGDNEKPDSSPNTNNSLTSLSSDTSPSGCSLLESPGSDTKFIPSTVVIKKDVKSASKGKVSLSKSSDARVGASSSATLPIAAQPSKANKLTLEEFLNESSLSLKCPAPHHPTTDWEKYKPAKYFDSLSSDGEDGKVPWKVGTDTSAFPLLPLSGAAGPSSTNTQSQKNRRVTYNFAQRDSKDTSSGHSDDSEGQMMEENFQKCLQNFNKIPGVQRPKIYSRGRINRSLPSSSSSASRRRRLASSRSQSFMRSIADDVTTSDVATTSRATSSGVRQRHPAGGDATEGTKERTSSDPSAPEGANPDEPMTEEQKLHFAKSHADTSEGAVHSFQDETGRWMTYTFSSDGPGVAYNLANNQEQRSGSVLRSRSASSRTRGDSSTSSVSNREQRPSEAEAATGEGSFDPFRLSSRRGRGIPFPEQQVFLDALRRSIENGQRMAPHTADASPPSITTPIELYNPEIRAPSPKVKIFYKMKLFGTKEITIQYDRLALLDLLDRNSHRIEVFISILFMVVVAFLGIQVLARNLLFDLWAFWFCVVIATSQFPLIRSVQPDSASPTHGYNRVIAYSRPFYFTICASLLILFNYLADESNVYLPGIPIYGVTLFDNKGCAMGRDFMLVFTLLLPVVFVCGLLPQVNTFVMYLCEQTEIHAFGGTASSSIFSSLFSVSRSILTVALLYGFCYGAAISKEGSQNILYSAFCGLLVAFSYHLSRQTSSPHVLWKLLKTRMFASSSSNNGSVDDVTERGDPSKEADDVGEKHEINAVSERLQSDVVLCPTIALFTFAIHCSTAFAALQPALSTVLYVIAGVVGLVLHYLLPQLRKNLPWLFFSRPILKSKEHDLFEVTSEAQLMWYERVYAWLCFCEQNLLFPLIVLSLLSFESQLIVNTYGPGFGSLVLVVVGLKLLRSCFGVPAMQYLVISFSVLFVKYDARLYAPSVLVSYFFFGILFVKFQDLVLKLQFWMVYVAPWQITWGSAFHAFTQPFAVPHSAFLTAHAVLAALLQAPFAPFLGSALFLASYPRPLKFWERNYKTKRIDNSNTRLSTQLDRGPHSDDNNLNSIFYEHLTYSLQKSLAGDVTLGRWGNVYSGDCFILTSDNLNALVHLVELGNGIVTFQLRGLEFSGTYCHQREVEAINEGADDNDSCCCCRPGRIRGLLSFNSTFNQRWLAWEVLVSNYVLDGYSISDNNATTMLGVFDLRKILLNYIVKSIIFFLISHDSLVTWLEDAAIRDAVQPCEKSNYADVDSTFAVAIDDDYDVWLNGVSPVKFQEVYGDWIEHCVARRNEKDQSADNIDGSKDSKLVTLCFAISVLGRRALGTASHNFSSNLDAFLYGLHALFKGDFRITASKDEWIFSDMNLLHEVVAPGVRTAVKLHQDHFACPEDYDQPEALYDAISDYTQNMVIAHEGNPIWRKAVLSNTPSLLALRRVVSDTLVDQYSVITLNHRSLGFNIVKVNRESVRGLWAGQQNELVFLRNRNPERGSIQNAKQVLRNMINSSCDQPIGYPIYVSPLTSSYASTNQQLTRLLGGPITFKSVRNCFSRFVACLRQSCSGSCNSGGSAGMPVQQSVPLQSISRTSSRSAPIPAPGSRHPSLARGLHRPAPSKPPTPPQDPTFTTTAFTASGAAERVHRRVVSAVDMPATRVRHTSSLGGQKRASLAQDPLGDFPLGKLVFHSSASIAGSKKSDASFKRSRDSNEEPSESRRVTLLSSRPSASGSDVSDRRDNPSI